MKGPWENWKKAVRLVICVLLLGWIFHAIFVAEGQRHWEGQTPNWTELSRAEQWRIAWSQGPQELWRTLSLIELGPFLLSCVFMGMTILLGVIRWRLVLAVQGLHLSFGRTAEISLVAHFFNSFLLGSSGGDLLKAYYAAQETHHKKTEAVITVLVDRLLGLFAMLIFACLMVLANFQFVAAHGRLTALAWVIAALALGVGGVIVISLWGGLSRGIPQARVWLRKLPKGELLERAVAACREYGRQKHFFIWIFLLSMALNVFCVLQIQALAWGLNIEVPLLKLFVIVPVIVCISALPITPSGLGVRENLYVWMLAVPEINVPATSALSLSLLAYAGFALWSIMGGIVYVFRKRPDHLPEIQEAQELPAAETES